MNLARYLVFRGSKVKRFARAVRYAHWMCRLEPASGAGFQLDCRLLGNQRLDIHPLLASGSEFTALDVRWISRRLKVITRADWLCALTASAGRMGRIEKR